jgi:hypothetical protein
MESCISNIMMNFDNHVLSFAFPLLHFSITPPLQFFLTPLLRTFRLGLHSTRIFIRSRDPFFQHCVKHGQKGRPYKKADNPASSKPAQHAEKHDKERNLGAAANQHGSDHIVDVPDHRKRPDREKNPLSDLTFVKNKPSCGRQKNFLDSGFHRSDDFFRIHH